MVSHLLFQFVCFWQDLNGATALLNFLAKKSCEILAEQSGESHEQILKYIRLIHLNPDLLELVDNFVLREREAQQFATRPVAELSYLRKEERPDLFAVLLVKD